MKNKNTYTTAMSAEYLTSNQGMIFHALGVSLINSVVYDDNNKYLKNKKNKPYQNFRKSKRIK